MTTSAAPRTKQPRHAYRGVIGIALLVQMFLPANLGLALASQETAQDQNMAGVGLLRDCNDAMQLFDNPGSNPTASYASAGMCMGYLRGFIAGHISTESFYQARFHFSSSLICLPKEWTTDQAVRIVVKWLNDHPERLHLNEGVLVMQAFQEAFPCK